MSYKEKLITLVNQSELTGREEFLTFLDILDEEYLRVICEQNEKDPFFLLFLANNLAKKKAANDTESQAMWKEILGEEEKYLESLS